MKKLFDFTNRVKKFLYRAILHSGLYRAFGSEGIKGSVFYALLCFPYKILKSANLKYGEKANRIKSGARVFDLKLWIMAFAAVMPFLTKVTYIFGIILFAVYVFEAISEGVFIKKPSAIDALIYIFAAVFAVFSGGLSAGGFLAILLYSALTKSVTDIRLWKKVVFVFLASSVLSGAIGRFGGDKAFSEFYILTVPFGFAAAREFEKENKALIYGLCVLLALIFMTRLSKGNITPSGIALGIFLCMRDVRFVLPVAAILGALLGVSADFVSLVEANSFSILKGTASLLMSGVFYLNIMNYSSKKSFMRTVTAAVGSGSVLFLSGGGQEGLEYMFFTILALTSSRI